MLVFDRFPVVFSWFLIRFRVFFFESLGEMVKFGQSWIIIFLYYLRFHSTYVAHSLCHPQYIAVITNNAFDGQYLKSGVFFYYYFTQLHFENDRSFWKEALHWFPNGRRDGINSESAASYTHFIPIFSLFFNWNNGKQRDKKK